MYSGRWGQWLKSWHDIRDDLWRFAGGLLFIVLLGVIDLASGLDLSLSVFYLLPIYWLTWHFGLPAGVLASMLAASTWQSADVLGGQFYNIPWAPYWNLGVRLTLFLLTTVLIHKFKTNQERRNLLERLFFHDLLNLAGSLRGFTELLQNDNLPDKREITRLLGETTEHIIEEIESQRLISAAESGRLTAKLTHMQTGLFLETLQAIYRCHPCARGRSLELGEPLDDCLLQSDEELLTRVIGNLLKNALEATPPTGAVTITCRSERDEVVFAINNPGEMPPQVRRALFREGTTTKGRGRGLGLRSIRMLVDILGGRIDLTSDRTRGTTFYVRLPHSR